MSCRRTSLHRRSLVLAVHLALFASLANASTSAESERFPAYLDGYLVPSDKGAMHHADNQLSADVKQAAIDECAKFPSFKKCELIGHALREVASQTSKESAYTKVDITIDIVNQLNESYQAVFDGGILAVRSCPTDAVLATVDGITMENRDKLSGEIPVACISPEAIPKAASLGVPRESGANQCPIGNSPTVGNPLNPLTGSKIEVAVDYAGPTTSGLMFGRTYHSGSFSLQSGLDAVARYPERARIGARWRHTWDRQFMRRPYYDKTGLIYATALHLVREDGNETRFVKQGDTFVAAEGERGTLREHPEGGWMYTWPDLTVERYDGTGRLRSRTDANGNEITLHYDDITVGIGLKASVLVRVTDRQGRALILSYDRLGRVETVDTPDGRINYSYAGGILDGLDADLTSVKYPDGRRIGYHYDEPAMGGTPNHKLTGIVGGDGERFATFHYDVRNHAFRSAHGGDLEWTEVDTWSFSNRIGIESKARTLEEWYPIFDHGQIRLGRRHSESNGERIFEYDGAGRVARQTDYSGTPTTYRYDQFRQLEVERIEADGTPVARTVKTTWHPVFDKPTRIERGTQWITLDYDAKGNLVEQREGGASDAADTGSGPWPDERVYRYAYDATGRLLSADGPLAGAEDTTRYAYYEADASGCAAGDACAWRKGDLHTVTNALGHVDTVLAYDAAGRVSSSIDANGVRTDRRYDAMGRPLEVAVRARRDGSPSTADIITRVAYNANGDIGILTDADGATLTHRYNAAHRLVEQIDALGHRRLITPDGEGRIKTETWRRADGTEEVVRTYRYNNQGHVERISHEDGTYIAFERDADGRVLRVEGSHIDSPTLHRDALGRVERMTDIGATKDPEILLSYDGADKIKTVVDPKGLSTSYLRNGLGDLLWQRSPDTGDTNFENDATGQTLTETSADGRRVKRTYDALGRVAKVVYSDGQTTHYTYDATSSLCGGDADFAVGRLSTITETSGSTTLCYDFAGRVVQKSQVTKGIRLDLRYAYTKAGRLAAVTYPDGHEVVYVRDAAGRVTGVETRAPLAATRPILADVRYDAMSRPIQWNAGSRTLSRTHNGIGGTSHVRDDRADGLKLELLYEYGDLSEIKADRASIEVLEDTAKRISMTDTGLFNLNTYYYDGTGNRTLWGTTMSARFYQYAPDSHHLIVANKVPREYDATGNTTKIGDREFVYDATGRMTQAKVNGVVEMNYAYNAFGQQVAKSIAGTTTVSLHDEAGRWLGDYDGAGRPIRQVVWLDDLPVAALDGDIIRDIQPDHLGTPRVVIDRATDKAIWTWPITGEAFGTTPPNEDPDKDGTKYVFDMRFPGQRYDAVTRLFQNGWRDYDPTSGRYIQSDPIGLAGGISTYAYAASNPYTRIDPLGLFAEAGPSASFGLLESVFLADAAFLINYRQMRQANTIGADKYFHCKANCEAAKLGLGGIAEATIVSETREYTDQYIKGDPRWACDEDRAANQLGRSGGRNNPSKSCSSTCAPLRPNGLDPRY